MNSKFNGYCLIYEKEINEGVCVEIVHELMELKKEEYLSEIKKYHRAGKTNNDIYDICKQCPNSPYNWRN